MSEETSRNLSRDDVLRMAADIVSAYVSQNQIPAANVAGIISTVYQSLSGLDGSNGQASAVPQKPAVPIKRSVTPDFIVCLEDGKKLKMLKRHLRTTYAMTPEEYRAKWKLAPEYPMVAPNYAKQRSDFARKIGLGRKTTKRKKSPRGAKR